MKILAKHLFLIYTGWICIATGLLTNQFFMAYLFSDGGAISSSAYNIAIWVFNCVMIFIGLVLIKNKSFNKSIIHICINILIIFLLVFMLESVFYLLNTKKNNEVLIQENYVLQDSLLGYKPKPDKKVHSKKIIKDITVYDVTYTIDKYGRRYTPTDSSTKNRFAIFFGCSHVFGAGVNDNETLPYYFGTLDDNYHSYNYGFLGYGPQQMLALLESGALTDQIQKNNGVALYLFTDDHVQRAVGSMTVYNLWGENMPYYVIDDDTLLRKGNFTTGRSFISFIYKILGKSNIVDYFNISFPIKINNEHLNLTALVIAKAADYYKSQFNNDNFYVLFKPESKYVNALAPMLNDRNVNFLDYTNLFNKTDSAMYIIGDGHPSAEANKRLAKKLVKDISKMLLSPQ
ncbi:MAG: hypothetical protein JKY33_05565 [Bacteroidia bacterium]|nr:hypothetical protein [Bacteroidia bacterium]